MNTKKYCVEISADERVDDLQYKGLQIIQKKKGFCFGVDAVLLSDFADVKKNAAVLDLGTGTGIIPILIAGKTQAKSVTGIEIQAEMAEMAGRSIRMNGLEDRVRMLPVDLREAVAHFGASTFDVVLSNPPYMPPGGGLLNPCSSIAVARHEICCTLEDVVRSASGLLKPGGQLAMIHRPERLVDILCLMRQYGIEPKFLRFVHPSPYKKANLLLVKGSKGGRPMLKMMAPLYVYDENGSFSDEIDRIYCRNGESNGKRNTVSCSDSHRES